MKSIANPMGERIVETARECIGTPWHHQGRVVGVGLDCVGMLEYVGHTLNLTDFHAHDYARIPDGVTMQATMDLHLDRVPFSERQTGDILLFRIKEQPQHVGIITDINGREGIIHAHAPSRRVVEHGMDSIWKARVVQCYRFKNVVGVSSNAS
jgi:NlpC/P60 family putative phage cell wall peptidase